MASASDIRSYIQNQLYIAILGRDPVATGDSGGLDYWVQQTIDNGWSLDQLRQAWMTSAGITLQQSTQAAREALAPAIFPPSQPTVTAAPVVTTSPPAAVAQPGMQPTPTLAQTVVALLPSSVANSLTDLVSPQSVQLPAIAVPGAAAAPAVAAGGISPLLLAAGALFLLRR